MLIKAERFYAICDSCKRVNQQDNSDNGFYFLVIPEKRDFEPVIGQYAIGEINSCFVLVSIRGIAKILAMYDPEKPVQENRILGILDKESGKDPYLLKDKVDKDNPSGLPF